MKTLGTHERPRPGRHVASFCPYAGGGDRFLCETLCPATLALAAPAHYRHDLDTGDPLSRLLAPMPVPL